jgi:AP2-associated kinase
VQSLLNEDQKQPNVQRTAHGYGKYTDDQPGKPQLEKSVPTIARKPVAPRPKAPVSNSGTVSPVSASNPVPAQSQSKSLGGKPPAPKKKPTHLNNLPTGGRPPSPIKQSQAVQIERLIAVDLPGQPILEMSAQDRADYIEDFTKRFPSLSSIEMESQGSRGSGPAQ